MSKEEKNFLTVSQLTTILVGSMIGIGLLSLPNDATKLSKQDGWIPCILGAAYPLYMVFLANIISKKYPKENILLLSVKCFGKVVGTILNFIFILYFLFIATEVAAGLSNVLRIYVTPFLNNYKVLATSILVPAFIIYKGTQTLGRINQVIFCLTVVIILIPIAAIKDGNISNVMPVFGSGFINIVVSVKETVSAYSGIEVLFLIYPFLQDSKNIKKCGITSVAFVAFVYTWITFLTIYYLGSDIIPKFLWSTVTLTESVVIPAISNFRYIFMILMSVVMFKTIANHYYMVAYGLSEVIKKVDRKTFALMLFPVIFYVSSKYGTPAMRGHILSQVMPVYVLFNFIYISTIALLISIKREARG